MQNEVAKSDKTLEKQTKNTLATLSRSLNHYGLVGVARTASVHVNDILNQSKIIFTITAEILARSLANFYCQ